MHSILEEQSFQVNTARSVPVIQLGELLVVPGDLVRPLLCDLREVLDQRRGVVTCIVDQHLPLGVHADRELQRVGGNDLPDVLSLRGDEMDLI